LALQLLLMMLSEWISCWSQIEELSASLHPEWECQHCRYRVLRTTSIDLCRAAKSMEDGDRVVEVVENVLDHREGKWRLMLHSMRWMQASACTTMWH